MTFGIGDAGLERVRRRQLSRGYADLVAESGPLANAPHNGERRRRRGRVIQGCTDKYLVGVAQQSTPFESMSGPLTAHLYRATIAGQATQEGGWKTSRS